MNVVESMLVCLSKKYCPAEELWIEPKLQVFSKSLTHIFVSFIYVLYGVRMPEPEVPQKFRYVLDYLSRMPMQLDTIIELLKKQNELLMKRETKIIVEEEKVRKRAEFREIEEGLVPIIKPIVTRTNEYTGIMLSKDFIVIPVVNAPVEIGYITFYDDLSEEQTHKFAQDTSIFVIRAEDNDIYYAPWSTHEKTPDRLSAGSSVIYAKSSKWKEVYLREASPGGKARIIELRYSK